ncbi:glycosyltransferase family 4 protein [Paraburkholderia acidisoli]|uniref:Glycosyltransferase n=1 Tax=Paraburkholderia acidisoli TaxID=2571748 RepID=A0A7Z2GIW8_9BURK|nr:glycosyltransferase family 4 protein [Paraburkholderia acidisoli]QGZ62309.1 glycosyltransferase [Paraburkholderia acidisoli]
MNFIPLRVIHVGPGRAARGGIASLLAAMEDNGELFKAKGISLHFLSTLRNSECGNFRKIIEFFCAICHILLSIVRSNIDIVHLHSALKGSLIRKIIISHFCIITKTPYIFQVHNGGFFENYLNSNFLFRFFIRRSLRYANYVIVLSHHMQQIALSSGLLESERCLLIYNGIVDPVKNDFSEEYKRKYEKSESIRIVFLGLISQDKGILTLLDAIKIIDKNHLKFRVDVYGNGNIPKFEMDVVSRELEDIVKYGGWINGDAKRHVMSLADIFVLPSRSEGFSIAVLEAMAFGLTIVATSIPGIVDAVRDGIEAKLVSPNDAAALADTMRSLMTNPEFRERLGAAARQRYLAHFTMEEMVTQLQKTYFKCARSAI